jgi:hypothetical protein
LAVSPTATAPGNARNYTEIPVEFQMSLTSSSDVIVGGTYSDSLNRTGAADGNFLTPQLTVFTRAVGGNFRFVGPVSDDELPISWEGSVQAQTATGEILWSVPFTAEKQLSWDDYAGEYPLPCTTATAPGGFDDFTVGTTYIWTVEADGSIHVTTNNGERYPSPGSTVRFGDLHQHFPNLPEGLTGIVYLRPIAGFDADDPEYDEVFGTARREDGSTVAAIRVDRTAEEYLFDDAE